MIRFIDVLGRTLSKPRLRQLCQAVELNEVETRLMLCRCGDGLSYDQIADLHNISPRQQRVLVPKVNNKVRLWTETTPECLASRELAAVNRELDAHNLPPID